MSPHADAGVSVLEAEARVSAALGAEDYPALRDALLGLTAALERLGRTGQSHPRASERWFAMRAGTGDLLTDSEIQAERDREAAERRALKEDAISRARRGDHVEGRSAEWHRAVRAGGARVMG